MARAIVRGFFDKLKSLLDVYMVESIGTNGKDLLVFFKDLDEPYKVRYENVKGADRRIFDFKQEGSFDGVEQITSQLDEVEALKVEVESLRAQKEEYSLLIAEQLEQMDELNDRMLRIQEYLAELNQQAAQEKADSLTTEDIAEEEDEESPYFVEDSFDIANSIDDDKE